jgi:hypothetical protein
MKFLCKLLIWTFCACLLAFRTQAKKGQRPITYHCVLVVTIVVCFAGFAHARWKPEYANMPAEIRAWYAQAQTMPDSRPRKEKGYVGCCNHGDVVDAQFETKKTPSGYVEEWYYKTPEMAEYKRIPNDIIHWGEAAPYGLPTLFVYNGEEICFWPPNGAI